MAEKCYIISDMSLPAKILQRARRAGAGALFTPKTFRDLGSRAAIDQALGRLAKAGSIRRVARGVYDLPQRHRVLGVLSPDPDAVARAIADQAGYRLQPTPARAANLLGVSTQVPAQLVYLTDGTSRKIKVGNQVIQFKHASPRALLGAGTPAGVALQAIRAVGPDNITSDIIQQFRRRLPSDTKAGLRQLARYTPQWTAFAIDAITA